MTRLEMKARLAVLVSNLKLKVPPGFLDQMANDAERDSRLADAIGRLDANDAVALCIIKSAMQRAARKGGR